MNEIKVTDFVYLNDDTVIEHVSIRYDCIQSKISTRNYKIWYGRKKLGFTFRRLGQIFGVSLNRCKEIFYQIERKRVMPHFNDDRFITEESWIQQLEKPIIVETIVYTEKPMCIL